jgi:hypothetical protein
MKVPAALLTAFLLAGAAPAALPDLDWMAGYWLRCEAEEEVAEYWTARRGTIMLGGSITSGKSFFWEQARIEAGADGRLAFLAQPKGVEATRFPLLRAGGQEAVFQNEGHDFPQRVIYRREGDILIGRIEGVSKGKERSAEWRYTAAPFDSRCPAG